MNLEMEALHKNNTHVLVELPSGIKAIGCRWIWKIKYKSSGEVVRCLIALSVQNNWPLHQLDVINSFLYGDLNEEVYMELPPCYYDKNETKVSNKDGIFIAILVYVDDIVISRNNGLEIHKFKKFLSSKFMIEDLGLLKYFLGIKVLENENGLCLSQRKYCLELLSEYGMLSCKHAATPLQQNIMLNHEESENDKFLPNMTEY
ncbi:ribonuclease H-like domain-containing protein [Tanacetum coccineum]